MDIAADGSRPILRINVIARSSIEPTNSFNNNDSVENENLGDQLNESFCDQSNDNLGDDSMNGHDHSLDVEDKPVAAEDFEYFEEDQGESKLRSQPSHSFSDGTNFYMYQTFSTNSELQLLLDEAAARKSFDFAIVKSCSKYLKIYVLFLHKSIANCIAKVYNHAHHGYCMRHLDENLWVNHQCGDFLYLYYNAAKTYSLEEFNDHFLEFKDKSPEEAFVLENVIDFEKCRRAHLPGNMYDVMTTNIAKSLKAMLIDEREYPVTSIFNSIAKRFGELFRERHAYVLKSKGNKMVPIAERIVRKKMIEGNSLYVENITGDENQFTVSGAGSTSTVNLLKKSCSCREYDLVKIPCAHAMATLRSKHGDEYGMIICEYSSSLYKAETYLLAYSESINVFPIESEWCVPTYFHPLSIPTLEGRKENVSRVSVRISKARGGTNVQFVRDPDTGEPHV
uniref:Mutator-like transposase n=1 Tax=Solanum tuberosum TaxID=4113 RepID=M1DDE2_SOLTU